MKDTRYRFFENTASARGIAWTFRIRSRASKFFVPIPAFLSPLTACQEPAYTKNCYSAMYQQTWIMKENYGQEGSEAGSSMAFCKTAPVPVRNILTQVKSNEEGAASNTPIFYICSQPRLRMKVDILMPAKGLDCRLLIRTCKESIKIT